MVISKAGIGAGVVSVAGIGVDIVGNALEHAAPGTPYLVWVAITVIGFTMISALPIWLLWEIVLKRFFVITIDDLENPWHQKRLADKLKQLFPDGGWVDIEFATMTESKWATTLAAVFELAGWKLQLGTVPIESYRHIYLEGFEVGGHNEVTVNAVAKLLKKFGIGGIKTTLTVSDVPPTNPKWPMVQRKVRLIIGHMN